MTSKVLEIRDRATFITILATRLNTCNEQEQWLLAKAGFGFNSESQSSYIVMTQINGGYGKSTCDPYDWGDRTLQVSHQYIIENFDLLSPGEVVDVEYILGESSKPKTSDREYMSYPPREVSNA